METHRIELGGDGILRIANNPVDLTLDNIRPSLEYTQHVAKMRGGKIKIIIDPAKMKSMSKEARNESKQQLEKCTEALAVINRNPFVVFLFNLIMKEDKPGFPMRLFRDEKKAENWLKSV